MSYFDQGAFDIRCEWGLAAIDHLTRGEIAIVVDVLSFTTCVDVALSRGATVLPYPWKDDGAKAFAARRGAVLAAARGETDGAYSLSPSSLRSAQPGLKLVLPSPNGSAIAFAARSGAPRVAAGSLRNAAAVAAWAQRWHADRPQDAPAFAALPPSLAVVVIPAGEQWPDGSLRPAVEDLIGAGAVISRLPGRRSPEANAAAAAFERAADALFEEVSSCSSGRELIERGFRSDVELACELNVSPIVPVLEGEGFVDVG